LGGRIFQIQKTKPRRLPRFELIAGALCLDFVNTLDDRYSSAPKELLATYIDLARFGEDARILSDEQVDRLFTLSQQHPDTAERVRASAIRMREAMHEVLWAIVQRKPVPKVALMVLNGYMQEAGRHVELVPGKGRMEWRFDPSPNNYEAPLWPIARSAAELLASDQLQFVRACASKTCEWLFLDESKNHRRRWCDMTKCGNRAKVRSYYTRQKQAAD
jgi:predicted RNA-binding Zn ribbon-like protein